MKTQIKFEFSLKKNEQIKKVAKKLRSNHEDYKKKYLNSKTKY